MVLGQYPTASSGVLTLNALLKIEKALIGNLEGTFKLVHPSLCTPTLYITIIIILCNTFIAVLGQYPAACSAYKLEAPLLAAGLLTDTFIDILFVLRIPTTSKAPLY